MQGTLIGLMSPGLGISSFYRTTSFFLYLLSLFRCRLAQVEVALITITLLFFWRSRPQYRQLSDLPGHRLSFFGTVPLQIQTLEMPRGASQARVYLSGRSPFFSSLGHVRRRFPPLMTFDLVPSHLE